MDATQTTLYVFPDTNVLVQCKALGELDWNCLGSYDMIILILARPVIGELDKHKGLPGRLGKRAREVTPLLRRFLTEDFVEVSTKKKGAAVQVISGDHLKASLSLEAQLDYSTADDKLVGTVHQYQADNPDHKVLFLSHDTGPLMTAKRIGVPFLLVPDDWTLSAENDEQGKELRLLKEELKRLDDHSPKCEIQFVDVPRDFAIQQYGALTSRQIDSLVIDFCGMYPLATEFEVSQPERRPYEIAVVQMEMRRFVPVSKEQIDAYRNAYEAWRGTLRIFFETLHTKRNALAPTPSVKINLANTGSCPASNVEVRIEMAGGKLGLRTPQECQDYDPMTLESLPKPPAVPKARWDSPLARIGAMGSLFDVQSRLPSIGDLFHVPPPRDLNTFYWKNGIPCEAKRLLHRECIEWRHQDNPEQLILELVPLQSDGYVNDAIKVTLHATNLNKPLQVIQPVRFKYEEIDLWAEAEAQFGA